jgi:hypothetical protein
MQQAVKKRRLPIGGLLPTSGEHSKKRRRAWILSETSCIRRKKLKNKDSDDLSIKRRKLKN